jgi:IS30 family transposase
LLRDADSETNCNTRALRTQRGDLGHNRFLPTARKRGSPDAVSPDHLRRTIRHRRAAQTGAVVTGHLPQPRTGAFDVEQWLLVEELLALDWSPEQVAGWLALHELLRISHETIYLRVWRDRRSGGELWRHLRQAGKQRRKRYGAYDSRGRLAGKRHISERPAEAEARRELGHWEIDTVMGAEHGRNSVLTMVERKTGYLVMGKLARHCAAEATARCIELIDRQHGRVRTVTADNGTEFHSYAEIETATGALFYFATPHHAWERGTCENTNGLIRQYLPKRQSMAHVTQADCDAIAARLNSRPRKRFGYRTPEECYAKAR